MPNANTGRRQVIMSLGLLGASAVAGLAAMGTPAQADTGAPISRGLVVTTRQGRVKGTRSGGTRLFAGIPYAAPPVGERRFRAPEPTQPWRGVRDATVFGNQCVQTIEDLPAWRDPRPESEDCLYLNVWTPDRPQAPALPVMVWLHGGAFSYGSAGVPVYDGAQLAEAGEVVVVSINHRLNVFGYLWLGDVIPELAAHPTPGQQDIIAALQWVRDNITAFGGDPGNVTLFGESGGGAKIGALMATPSAHGLFHKAIVQSGSQLGLPTREEAAPLTSAVLDALGGETWDVARLQSVPTDQLKAAAIAAQQAVPGLGFQPVVDGQFIPRQTWADGLPETAKGIPMIIGTTSHEAVFFVPDMWTPIDTDDELKRRFQAAGLVPRLSDDQYQQLVDGYRAAMPASTTRTELLVAMATDLGMWHSALRQAETKLTDRSAPVFFYEFAWRTPCFGGSWAPHADELPFLFGNLTYGTAWDGTDTDAMRTADDPQGLRFRLAEQTMRAWASFARHDDPSTADLRWPAYDLQNRPTMVFDRGTSTVVADRNGARRRIVEQMPTAW